jgi:WD40 repeat protein
MSARTGFFSSGGTLPPDAPSYLERRADAEVLSLLRAGRSVSILDSRQKGKSSLISRVIHILKAEGVACVKLDLQRFGANLSAPQWYSSLGAAVQEQMAAVGDGQITTAPGLIDFMADWVKGHPSARLVVFFDEIDFVRALPFSADDLFAAVRACLNARSDEPARARISFCFIGSGLPGQLTRSPSATALDMSATVMLDDFALLDISAYAQALPAGTRERDKCIERIHWWASGHPYLTQFLCESLCAEPSPSPETVDAIVEEQFLGAESITSNGHLFQVSSGFLEMGGEGISSAALLDAYASIVSKPRAAGQFPKAVVDKLRLSGLIRVEDRQVTVRNRIYARVFSRRWVKDNLPEADMLRQRTAARRATLRTSLVALLVCSALGWLAVSNRDLARSREKALTGAVASRSDALREAYVGTIESAYAEANSDNWMAAAAAIDQLRASPYRSWEWSYLDGLLRRQSQEFSVPGQIKGIAAHGDGGGLTTITSTGLSWIRDGQPKNRILDVDPFNVFALSENGAFVAGVKNGQGVVEDAESGGARMSFPYQPVKFYPVKKQILAYDAAEHRFALLDSAGTPLLFSPLHFDRPITQVISDDGRRIAGMSRGEAFLLDGRTLAVIRRWKLANEPSSVVFGPKGRAVFVGFVDAPVLAFRDDGSSFRLGEEVQKAPTICLSVSHDGTLVAAGRGDGTVAVFDAATGRQRSEYLGHRARVSSVCFLKGDRQFASGDDDGIIRVWQAEQGNEDLLTRSASHEASSGEFSSDSRTLAVSDAKGFVELYDLEKSGRLIARLGTGTGSYCPIHYSKPLDAFVVFGGSCNILFISPRTGEVRKRLHAIGGGITSVHLFPDGLRAAVISNVGEVAILSLDSAKVLTVEKASATAWIRAAISPDGELLATGHPDGTVALWSTADAHKVAAWSAHHGVIRSLEFSPDGTLLASGGHDETVVLYDLPSKSVARTMRGHTSRIFRVRFSPDGTTLLSFSFDGTARLWDASTGRPKSVLRHRSWIADAAFNPAGDRVVTASSDQTVKLWDVRSGREVATLPGHEDAVFWAQFTPDGRTLVTVGKDGQIFARRTATTRAGG